MDHAVAMGVSPRRFAGWEPRTVVLRDEDGLIVGFRSEPEWSDWDRALLDCYGMWQAGVHRSCGHHQDEQNDPDALFVAGFTKCAACEALAAAQDKQREADKPRLEAGLNPDAARSWFVVRESKAAFVRAREGRQSAEKSMAEAVARLDSEPQST